MGRLSKSEKKKLCSGCRNNRYNMGKGYQETEHDAVVSCDECWSLEDASVCVKDVYYSPSQVKPIKRKALSCWSSW
jgi:hypothetical protein